MFGRMLAGRYLVREELGIGGMASVYLVEDSLDSSRFAAKVLHLQYARNERYLARFAREAETASRLDHPNIVKVFDCFIEEEPRFLLMEFVNGPSLAELLEARRRLTVGEAVDIAIQTADALEHARSSGILAHRDIKPQNILLTGEGTVKVTDFGIAKAPLLEALTHTAMFMGTPQYISPEQARGESLDIRSDIYSLCVLLFELLTGRTPFIAETPFGVVRLHNEATPPKAGEFRDGVPDTLEKLLARGLSKNPRDRFETPGKLAECLRALDSFDRTVIRRFAMAERPRLGVAPDNGCLPKEGSAVTVVARRQSLADDEVESTAKKRAFNLLLALLAVVVALSALAGIPRALVAFRHYAIVNELEGGELTPAMIQQIDRLPGPPAVALRAPSRLLGERCPASLLKDESTLLSRSFDMVSGRGNGALPAAAAMLLSSWGEEVDPRELVEESKSGSRGCFLREYKGPLRKRGYTVAAAAGGELGLLLESVANGSPVIVVLATVRGEAAPAVVYGFNARQREIILVDPSSDGGVVEARSLPYDFFDRAWKEAGRAYLTAFKEKSPMAVAGARLYPFKKDGVWGYAVNTGEERIPPRFTDAKEFTEGLAAVKTGGKWGYVDKGGRISIDAQFDAASHFFEGAARVRVADEWGFVDAAGRVFVQPQFEDSRDFMGDMAPVRIGGRWGYVNRKGEMEIDARFEDAWVFSGGLAKVRTGGTWGYIDNKGKSRIPSEFEEASPFSRGIAFVRKEGAAFCIDEHGKPVVRRADRMFNEGLLGIPVDDRWAYLDRDGRLSLNPGLPDAWIFDDGLAKAEIGGFWGYVDRKGKTVIPPRYEEASRFYRGLALVRQGDKRGYIDTAGMYRIGPWEEEKNPSRH
ncbi:MAG: WG repeat-containing protein [Candidatus Aquicultorales bacterium]